MLLVIRLKMNTALQLFFSDFRPEVLDCVVQLQNFQNLFLPNALRKFFCKISAPSERGSYLEQIIDRFSERFVNCNPHLGLHKGKFRLTQNFECKIVNIFLSMSLNICCGCSKELSH